MRRDHILQPVTGPLLTADAPALLYRAFFALPDSITDGDDRPVNALLGSVNAVLWCVERYGPRAVVLCYGAEAARYRTDLYPAYHAHRPPMPDGLADQWERAKGLYAALGWGVEDSDDLEADDLLHTLALAEAERGGTALILTGDRDLFQCASESVTVLLQRARSSDGPDEVDPDGVRERYGIGPEQVADFIALRGDPSDGLPGAKGIGAKTAADLLKRKGDLEHVILGAVREKPAVRRALIEQAAELRSFRDIALLRTAPVELPEDRPTDFAGGAEAARAAGMRRLAERLEKLATP
jgi:5'-3' exonuclease